MDFVSKVMSLLFNMLSRLIIAFLPKNKRLLISWLQSPSAVILEPKTINSATASSFSPLFAMKWWDQLPWSCFFGCWILSQLFYCPLSLSSRGSLVPLHFLPLGAIICISEVVDISPGNLDASLWFIQSSNSHDVLCIEVKLARWQYTALMYSFLKFEPVCCPMSGSRHSARSNPACSFL